MVWRNGEWVERKSMWEEAVISLGWAVGFFWNRLCIPTYRFMYDWVNRPNIRHSRALAILMFLFTILGMSILLRLQ